MRHFSLAAFTLLVACVAREPGGDGDSGSTDDTGGSDTSTTDTTATTTSATTTSATTVGTSVGTSMDDTTTDPTLADSSSESFSFITAPDMGSEPLPNGEECSSGEECESGFCREGGGQGNGTCSECAMDSDCEAGTCSFEFDVGFAVCTDGGVGEGCDSDEGCAGELVCAPAFGDGGPLRCSECSADLACDEGLLCSPVFGDSTFGSWLGCVVPGSVALGGGCPVVDGIGDGTACESGACGIETFMMGNLEIGICSECDGDDDCEEGMTCAPPEVDMGGITPGACGV